jgi:3-deoxy-D-manno-octulosonate 8-phosphate phosphatase (KDO 8-P phosphatase)
MKKNYKELLHGVTTFVFDVDGVLTDGSVLITSSGELLRKMNIKDGYAIKTAIEMGYRVCIISGGSNEGVKTRLRGLGVTDIFLGAGFKDDVLRDYMLDYGINASEVVYMGDDIPDIPAMKMAGLVCCPKNSVSEVKELAHYISDKTGGEGCVRDLIEQVLKVQGKWQNHYNAAQD